MLRRLLGIPRWLTVTLASGAAAALVVLSTLLGGFHGWALVVGLAFAALFTALAIALPQLQQWQAQQAARLDLRLEMDRRTGSIPHYADDAGVIDTWLAEEQSRCLESLRRWEAPVEPQAPSTSESTNADTTGKPADRPLAGVTIRDITRLQERRRSGEVLSDDETWILDTANRSMQALFSDPDTRSSHEYRAQVSTHLSSCRDILGAHVLWAYVSTETGLLRLALHNPTDRPFESVKVEVYLPGLVEALDPDDVYEPSNELPRQPRPFGERAPKIQFGGLIGPQSFPGIYSPPGIAQLRRGPYIDNGGSARITYDPLTLRPQTRETLPDIHLRVSEPPGTVIDGTWEATSTNAEGRVKGTLRIAVGTEPLPIRAWLTDLIYPKSST